MDKVVSEKGDFTLFGLFLREDAPDKWDLVVSAPWLEEGKLKALGEFVEKISSILGEQELLTLSRIVTLTKNDPALEAILKAGEVKNGPVEVRDSSFFGLPIKHGYILRAKRRRKLRSPAT